MDRLQSDARSLENRIGKLEKSRGGLYEFNWYHPIKLPVPTAACKRASFFDRARDSWIPVEPVVKSPLADDFDPKLLNIVPEEPETFMILGSFHVVLEKVKIGWMVSIDSLL